jgi:hypothetical protein
MSWTIWARNNDNHEFTHYEQLNHLTVFATMEFHMTCSLLFVVWACWAKNVARSFIQCSIWYCTSSQVFPIRLVDSSANLLIDRFEHTDWNQQISEQCVCLWSAFKAPSHQPKYWHLMTPADILVFVQILQWNPVIDAPTPNLISKESCECVFMLFPVFEWRRHELLAPTRLQVPSLC